MSGFKSKLLSLVRSVAHDDLDGHELTEGLLKNIDVANQAYDSLLSCATKALGQMPLVMSLAAADPKQLGPLNSASSGQATHVYSLLEL
ncbi:hypothetical protein RA876_15100 [Rhodoferax antarcticus]|nr:hypothetical protein RA876_15100 [Rhodoferax antarcticus]